MTSLQEHIIRRVVLQLDLNAGRAEAFHLQNELKSIVEEVAGEMDYSFSKMMPAGQTLSIKKLEVDLGKVSKRKFGTQLTKQLQKMLLGLQNSSPPRNSQVYRSYEANNAGGTSTSELATRISQSERNAALFYYFLQSGAFPWWAKRIEWPTWEQELIQQLETGGPEFSPEKIIRALQKNAKSLDRLIWQFSEAFLSKLARRLQKYVSRPIDKNRPASLTQEIVQLHPLSSPLAGKKAIRRQLEELIFRPRPAAVNFTGSHLAPSAQARAATVDAYMEQYKPMRGSTPTATTERGPDVEAAPQSIDPRSWQLQVGSQLPAPEQEGAFYINNAGLALILPCVTYLYQELGYLNENHLFKSRHKQARAIHLLQYLAFGKTQNSEPELLLNKVACGWFLTEPIRKNIRITKAEKEKADTFLQFLIDRWGALKKTYPDNLRYNFLMRDGKLSLNNGHWLLQVEKTAYDSLLMKKLPWTISIIKNKWMTQRIHVEWIN